MAQLPFQNSFGLFEPGVVAGKYMQTPFETNLNINPYEYFKDTSEDEDEMSESDYRKAKIDLMQDSLDLRKRLLSPEYQQAEIERLDELQARQMARAQKYGKESAFYGFMYQGLPKLMAQSAFSRYAFAPEMVKGVQDAYSRVNLAGVVKPLGGQSYMSINPMG